MRIGLLSFGGPAGQIAVMHRILVDEKRWISEERFLHALSYCMLLPGPEAQQLATYVGWLLHGTRGGLVAGTLFVLPGFIAIMALSIAYVLWQQHPLMEGLFLGLKAAVIALVIEALIRIGKRALTSRAALWMAGLAFVAIAVLRLPFPLIVLGAGLAGFILRARSAGAVSRAQSRGRPGATLCGQHSPLRGTQPSNYSRCGCRSGSRRCCCAHGWLGPPARIPSSACSSARWPWSRLVAPTRCSAYVAQQAVERFAWVTPAQMLDGLGLAESTPGPLIMVVQFVGFLAAYQAAGSDHPLLSGVLGAILTVWVTFVPCFLWIFLGAPYIEALRGNVALASALAAITAAVVGVIANLALWFATHVLFAHLDAHGLPELASLRPVPALLTGIALMMLFVLKWNLARTLTVSAVLGAASIDAPMTGTGFTQSRPSEPCEVTSYLPQSLFSRVRLALIERAPLAPARRVA